MQNNDEALLSISLAGHCQFVKMLTTLEPHCIFLLIFVLIHFKVVFGISKKKNNRQENCRSKQSYFSP